jgi:ubiquinone/menaquinone biosynthesis C-methylase UbiE
MNTQQAYDTWSDQYDTNVNKTRDLEAKALRIILADIAFESCLEIGCGTGKNTEYLLTRARQITAVDLSESMLSKAIEKINSKSVNFKQADITKEWDFVTHEYNLVTFSLMLEHIEDLDQVFAKVAKVIKPGGYVYIGELHPFKQYSGSKARFDTDEGQQVVTCFNHHVSDFVQSAAGHGLKIEKLDEYFDDDDRSTIPRILTLLLRKVIV